MSDTAFRVLIAEDSETVRDILSFLLSSNGYDTVEANDGVAAMKEVIRQKPDLILLDVDMPRMNGYQVCRIVKADAEFSDIPVIMLTSRDRQLDKMWGLSTGADDYVIKAMDDDDDEPFPSLGEAIERCLDGRTPRNSQPSTTEEITDGEVFGRLNILLDKMLFRMTLRRKVSDLTDSLNDLDGTVRSILKVIGDATGFAAAGLSLSRAKKLWMSKAPSTGELSLMIADKSSEMLSIPSSEIQVIGDSETSVKESSDYELISFPLEARQETVGTIIAAFPAKGQVDSAVVDTLNLLAANGALVLDNAQLFAGLEKTNEELQNTLDELTSTQVKLEETKEKVARLEILIDEKKKSEKVSAIVDSEYFDHLKEKVKKLRSR